ncbi:MAG: hypothetical protein K6F14_01670 [Clostridiales bacterium]|nr:hypothetical protein [Clostridiales bacterium]
MAKSKKDYFGLPWIVSLILAIIPITSWLFGFIIRFREGKIVAGLIRLIFGFTVVWLLDLIFMIFGHKICRLINC